MVDCGIFPVTGAKHFFDLQIGLHRCDLLGQFLGSVNAGFNGFSLSQRCKAKKPDPKGAFKIPDIISHRASENIFEFYEVKPNSATGIPAGREKVVFFTNLCAGPDSLPYKAGTRYGDDVFEVIWNGTYLGNPLVIELHWFLLDPGLLVYDICGNVDRQKLLDMLKFGLLKAFILAAAIMALAIMRGGAGLPTTPSPILALQEPVGPGEVNLAFDVTFVQHLLNDWRGRNGRESIGVDGLVGPQTNAAIIDFQVAVTGLADGIVSPAGPAIAALEQQHLDAWSASFTPGMLTSIGEVALRVTASEDEERLSVEQEDALYLEAVTDYFLTLYQT